MNKLISKFRKNSFEEIQINAREYKGRQYVDIRTYVGSPDVETVPTKKGVSIPIELYIEFSKGISILEDILEDEHLFDPKY